MIVSGANPTPTDAGAAAGALTGAVDRLCAEVSGWTLVRWSATGSAGRSTADAVFELVQRIADLAADAEGQPHRPVPRLDAAPAVTDQLRVVVADLIAAPAPVATLTRAMDLVGAATPPAPR
mgnify:CR=1 FL=1